MNPDTVISVPLMDSIRSAVMLFYRVINIGFDIGGVTITLSGAIIFAMIIGLIVFAAGVLLK